MSTDRASVMLYLPGGPALSDFRLAKRLERLQAIAPGVSGLDARFVHLVDSRQRLAREHAELLEDVQDVSEIGEVGNSQTEDER